MPSFIRNTSGGTAVSGGALAPRSRRGNTNQADAYWRGGGEIDLSSFKFIATTTVGVTPVSEIVFSSIPQNYKHLHIRCSVRNSVTEGNFRIQFNSDTAGNYSHHQFTADGSSTASYSAASDSFITSGNMTGVADIFTVNIIDVLNYTNTNIYKTTRSLQGFDRNGAGSVGFNSGNWRSTSAITSIRLFAGNNAFAQYSQLSLYGIEG
jgi:hypothetical protein